MKQSTPIKETTTAEPCEAEDTTGDSHLNQSALDQPKAEETPEEEPEKSSPDSVRVLGRNWWTEASSQAQITSGHPAAPRWDFSHISFPDLGSSKASHARLEAPDSKLLPGGLQVAECEVAPWLRKLNLRESRMSRRERERQRERDRYHRNINDDREVRRCRNWAEYLELMDKRKSRRRKERPAHLWDQDVTPLTEPGQCATHRKLFFVGVCTPFKSLNQYFQQYKTNFVYKIIQMNTYYTKRQIYSKKKL